jgi:membrane protease YdiL (CAAX protease family)
MTTPAGAPGGAYSDLVLPLPLEPIAAIDWPRLILSLAAVRALLPLVLIGLMAVPITLFFRKTWKAEAREQRIALGDRLNSRPAVCLVVTALSLTLQEYYGGRNFFQASLRTPLRQLCEGPMPELRCEMFDQLYGYAWWCSSRVIGYVILPLLIWKCIFPRDSVRDMGLRFRGFLSHLWIYGLCLAFVVPAMLIVARQSDFGTYYPFYKLSSRSWFDLLCWEGMYFAQFFALEFFFRGWMIQALRPTLGSAAIFAMSVPYCMIHYGKPYLEAHGAVVAGVVLGSLSARTKSVYAGFLVHITVALGMDLLSLSQRDGLPKVMWPF